MQEHIWTVTQHKWAKEKNIWVSAAKSTAASVAHERSYASLLSCSCSRCLERCWCWARCWVVVDLFVWSVVDVALVKFVQTESLSVLSVPSHYVRWMLASLYAHASHMNRDVNRAQSRRWWWGEWESVWCLATLVQWCTSVGGWLAHDVKLVGAWCQTMVARGCSGPRCPIHARWS